MRFYKDKNVLVTGGTGLIGVPLVKRLVQLGANVSVVSADSIERYDLLCSSIREFNFVFFTKVNLENYNDCLEATKGMDYVFQLAGTKGAGSIGTSKAATFLTSHLLINLNMLKASYTSNVKKYLLTSTVGVYPPLSNYKEDIDIFKESPMEGDKYSAWAKRISELAAEAFMKEYDWKGIVIVRPGSVYGPWDNFDQDTAMVVGSLIHKFAEAKSSLSVLGNAQAARDFTHTCDIAEGMLLALEKSDNCEVFNLSSGTKYTITTLVRCIAKAFPFHVDFHWESKTPSISPQVGNTRVLNVSKAQQVLGFTPRISLEEGIKDTVNWYITHNKIADIRYNAFK